MDGVSPAQPAHLDNFRLQADVQLHPFGDGPTSVALDRGATAATARGSLQHAALILADPSDTDRANERCMPRDAERATCDAQR